MIEDVQKHVQEQRGRGVDALTARHRPPLSTGPSHVEELERENERLQLLVAELLIKNQQLRKPE